MTPSTNFLLDAGLLLLAAAAMHDVLARTIPNALPALIACLGAVLHATEGTLTPAIAAAAALFAATLICWRRGWLGGGDAKLLAAASLLLPPDHIPYALTVIALLGAALTLPYIAARGRLPRPPTARRTLPLHVRAWRVERFRLRRGGPLPYAAAIAGGVTLAAFGGAP